MKKLTLLFIFTFSLVASFLIPGVQAKTEVTCTPCIANITWNTGGVSGLDSTFTVSNPGIVQNYGYWDRYIQVGHDGQVSVTLGIEQDGSSAGGPFCGGANGGTGLWYFDHYIGTTSNGGDCVPIPSGDINTLVSFKIAPYSSNGGGMFVQTSSSAFCQNGCFQKGLGQTYYPVYNAETIDDSFIGHEVWGSEWIYNQFQNASGTHYWASNGSSSIAQDPPQMFWHIPPSQVGSLGGTLYSCDYDTGSTCTLGK